MTEITNGIRIRMKMEAIERGAPGPRRARCITTRCKKPGYIRIRPEGYTSLRSVPAKEWEPMR